jgi:hypothetical protein
MQFDKCLLRKISRETIFFVIIQIGVDRKIQFNSKKRITINENFRKNIRTLTIYPPLNVFLMTIMLFNYRFNLMSGNTTVE